MNQKALNEIDYFRIRDVVASFCVSLEAKESLLQKEPLTNFNEIEKLKNMGREWTTYLDAISSSPLSSWQPISPLFAIIKTNGACLSLEQVHNLGEFVLSVKKVFQSIEYHKTQLKLKLLEKETQNLPDLSDTEKKIFKIITPDGTLRDLPEITVIRKAIASLNAKIKTIMQSFTSDQKLSSALESTVPVLRNGRQVLAVKSNQQNRIAGIIHEVSQSSQTVYIEPEEAVRCSNELIQKEQELQQVIKRILTELTLSLQPSIPLLKTALPIMILLDQTLAASRWGKQNNCIYAQHAHNEPPVLLQARHPLLKEKAVPIDIRFMSGKNVLIITGPNTGGKTVCLKTFALFAMLNQTGFPIPATENSKLPLFTDIYADIGDDQSIDQSLSTFSAHMKNIAQAVTNANSSTLVLLDELGSGTDPQEGTAISMAVLDKLIEAKAFVLVTTHQGILKNYGYTNPCCVNASVEFDANTLSPSYHLLMGVPGESHALDIAQKNGLPLQIVKAAREYIATEQADVSALIRGLNRKHIELNKVQKSVESEKKQAMEKTLRLKEKELDLRKREAKVKEGKHQELNDFLIHSRRQLENLVRTLKEGEITREKTLSVKQFISDLEKDTKRLEQKFEKEEIALAKAQVEFEKEIANQKITPSNKKTKKKMSNAEALKTATSNFSQNDVKNVFPQEKPLKFEEGAYVVAGNNANAGVLIKEEKKGVWQVQFGSLKMSVKQKDLKLVKKSENLKPSVSYELSGYTTNGNYIIEKDTPRPSFELKLLGMRVEEALKALERQIDLCVLNNLVNFSVIHGKGDGVLQQAVKDYLSHCPVVKEFGFAPAEDGGAGKTYVSLN